MKRAAVSWWLLPCVVGLAIRLVVHAVVAYRYDLGDAAGYDATARGLLEWGTYADLRHNAVTPSWFRAPGYAAFISVIFALAGHSYFVVRVVQTLVNLGAALCLAQGLSRHHPPLGRVVLWCLCLSPFEAVYTGALLSETLAGALLLVGLSVPLWRRDRRGALVAGVCLGLVCLTREVFLLWLPLAAWAWPGRAHRAWVLAAALLCIAPWTLRNYAHSSRFIPISEGRLGYSLWLGTWALDGSFTTGDAAGQPRRYPPQAFADAAERAELEPLLQNGDDRSLDRATRAAFWRKISEHPIQVVGVWLRRLPRLWVATRFDIFGFKALDYGSSGWWLVKIVLLVTDSVLVGLSAVGLIVCARWRAVYWWWALPIVYTTAVFAPLNSFESRYSQPVLAVATLFAVIGAASLRRRWSA